MQVLLTVIVSHAGVGVWMVIVGVVMVIIGMLTVTVSHAGVGVFLG